MGKKKALVLGGSGLLGSKIISDLVSIYDLDSPSHLELDLTNLKYVDKAISNKFYDYIIYAAGVTNQRIAEIEKDLAYRINYEAINKISKITTNSKTKIVYFSTDAVFDGRKSISYEESSPINPINYYGLTKAKGEEAVLENPKNLVIRLVSLYTARNFRKLDFVRKSLKSVRSGSKCFGIIDQFFNPTYDKMAINVLRSSIKKNLAGIVHVGAKDQISNFEFINLLLKEFGYGSEMIEPVKFNDFFVQSSLERGQFQTLNIEKSLKYFGEIMTTNAQNLEDLKKNYVD